jgi:hypothetical protein
MRARHRHFNPRDAGALVALDSRYGFSLSDGALVESWNDRTSNNNHAVQSTSSLRPSYETNELNGQPVISFNSKRLDCVPLSTAVTSNALTCISISNRKTGGTVAHGYGRVFSVWTSVFGADFNNIPSITTIRGSGVGGFAAGSWSVYRANANVALISGSYDTHYIQSFTLDGSTVKARTNTSTEVTGTTSATSLNAQNLWIGGNNAADSYLLGNIGMVTIIRSVVSDAFRKRLEHAAAFSFKLDCN